MRKLTKKQQFLKIIFNSKFLKINTSFLRKLYKKFLSHYKKHGKCTSSELFEVTSCRNIMFYINRGYTEAEAKQEVHKKQSRGISFYNGDTTKIKERVDKRQKTFDNKSVDEIKDINRKKGISYNIEFITKKYGINENEAQQKVKQRKLQKVESYKKHLSSIGGYKREWSARCIEYYLNKGLSEKEASIALHKISDTRSLDAIIKRRGVSLEAAKDIQHDIALKCKKTFELRSPEEIKEVLIKRTKFNKRYSNKSKKYFEKIINLLNLNLTYLYADFEYFIYKDNKIYWYDLTIPELKIIIEYNGVIFHPRKKDNWVSTIADSIKRDNLKHEAALSNGFTVLYVWENEEKETIDYILEVIRKQYNIAYESK